MNPYTYPGIEITKDQVIEVVSKVHRVLPELITSKTRVREVVEARQHVIVICRMFLRLTLTMTGVVVMRDHSTVSVSLESFKSLIRWEKEYLNKFIESCRILGITDEEITKVCAA